MRSKPQSLRAVADRRRLATKGAHVLFAALLALGCSDTRVPEQFCSTDCRQAWEQECATLCGISEPALTPGGTDGSSGLSETDGAAQPDSGGVTMTIEEDAGGRLSCADCAPALCNADTGECDPCTQDAQCPEAKPHCGEDGQCAPCTADEQCTTDRRPHCAVDRGTCEACVDSGDCTSNRNARCENNQCIPCDVPADCTSPDAPFCNNGVCEGCRSSDDCARFDAIHQLCDPSNGRCVQCTAADNRACCTRGEGACCATADGGDEADCQYYVCNLADQQCSEALPGTARICDPCVSDQQCEPGLRCVMQRFGDGGDAGPVEVGHVCLRESADDDSACTAPYTRSHALDVVGDGTARVCDLRNTTCRALNEFRKLCGEGGAPDDRLCGHPDADGDGVCTLPEGDPDGMARCSLPCDNNGDCPSTTSCGVGDFLCEI